MTGSWDKTLKYWDGIVSDDEFMIKNETNFLGRTQGPVLAINLPDKMFCANAKYNFFLN